MNVGEAMLWQERDARDSDDATKFQQAAATEIGKSTTYLVSTHTERLAALAWPEEEFGWIQHHYHT